LERLQEHADDGHLHILLGRDDDGQVAVEDEDGVDEADVVGDDDGRHGAVSGLAFDGDVVVAHAGEDRSGHQPAAPEQEAAETVERLEERVGDAEEGHLDAHPGERHEAHHEPQAQEEQRDVEHRLHHLVERPRAGLVEGVHPRQRPDRGRQAQRKLRQHRRPEVVVQNGAPTELHRLFRGRHCEDFFPSRRQKLR
jgi:hypothetical protein